jgi:X-Pro dipeptidyl-peptidase
VGKIKAAVLMAHAFNDWNVVPEHSVRIYEALKGKVPLQAYFHQGGHGGAPPMEQMNRWFTRYLYGVQNGVESEPRAWIVREAASGAARPAPMRYADYPNPEASPVTMRLEPGGNSRGGLTVSTSSAKVAARQGTEALLDNVEFGGAALAKAEQSPNRLLYATAELTAPVHLSGTALVTVRLSSSKPAANLSVWLVVLPWADGPIGPANLITRGWADPQNHASLTAGGDYHSFARGEPLVPGRFYNLTFSLQPDDQIIPAGKRIGLMIFSSDRDFTLWPKPGTELTLDLDGTRLTLPVVGGTAALTRAVGQ